MKPGHQCESIAVARLCGVGCILIADSLSHSFHNWLQGSVKIPLTALQAARGGREAGAAAAGGRARLQRCEGRTRGLHQLRAAAWLPALNGNEGVP